MIGPKPPSWFDGDGCTFAPDWLPLSRVDLTPACRYHDWAYHRGTTTEERKIADAAFFLNLRTCGAGRIVAGVYWLAVRLFGGRAYRSKTLSRARDEQNARGKTDRRH